MIKGSRPMLDGSGNLPRYAPYGELEAGRPAIEAIATTLPAMLEQYSKAAFRSPFVYANLDC
jgi:hypothetical protein